MTISAICSRTGVSFATSFGTGSYSTSHEKALVHPVFFLPRKTVYHLSQPETFTDLGPQEKALLHIAVWNLTDLLDWKTTVNIPTEQQTNLYFSRTLEICKWLEFRGKSSDLPLFCVDRENRDNLFSGFLKELESYREIGDAKREARDLNAISQAMDIQQRRRDTYGLKALTPSVVERVCALIKWTGPNADIAKEYLLADANKVLSMLDSEDLYLADLAELMLDIEILDWQGLTRDIVLAHLRGLVNIIYTFRPFTAEEKGLFTDTIETATDFLESFGGSGSQKIVIDNETREGTETEEEDETAEGAGSLHSPIAIKAKTQTIKPEPETREPTWAKFRKESALAVNTISPEAIQQLKGMTMKEVLAARKLEAKERK